MTQKIRVMDAGPLDERVCAVLAALVYGWTLSQSDPYGAHLLDPNGDIYVIPRDVMEQLIADNLITFYPDQLDRICKAN
jgi:hypothetical protein